MTDAKRFLIDGKYTMKNTSFTSTEYNIMAGDKKTVKSACSFYILAKNKTAKSLKRHSKLVIRDKDDHVYNKINTQHSPNFKNPSMDIIEQHK